MMPWEGAEPVRRAIQGNQSNERPHQLVFFDTETTTATHEGDWLELPLQLGYAERVRWQSGRGKWSEPTGHDFDTREGFWTWLEDQAVRKKLLWVFAHNFAGFDLKVMGGFEELIGRGWKLTKLIAECPPFVADFEKDGKKLRLIDSLNYARMPLAKIGEALGLPKMEDPGEEDVEARRVYCRNDVAILRSFICGLIDFVQEHDLGNFSLTMASQAMNAWRHRFAPHYTARNGRENVKVFPSLPEESLFERKAYMAGRTEAFYIGHVEGPVHSFDVNSLFPAVMRDNLFPSQIARSGDRLPPQRAKALLDKGLGLICEVVIDTDRPWYPQHDGERMVYPVGRFTTYLCTPELALALDSGHVVSIGRWQSYRMVDLFSTYVEYFYERRQEYKSIGNDLYQLICKVGFLNSLYGKFGQKVPEWTDVTGTEEADFVPAFLTYVIVKDEDNPPRHYRRIGNLVERREPVSRDTARNAFVAIAAHVTSYARVALLHGITTAEPSNVYYCDTDSVYTNDEGAQRLLSAGLVDQSKLGSWKHEGTQDSIDIHGPKDYAWGTERKIKGVRKTAEQIAPNEFMQAKFQGFKGSLRAGATDIMLIRYEKKVLRRVYLKGVVGDDGWVTPFVRRE